MRNATMFGLPLLLAIASLGADAPIPQDTARMEKRSRERLEWNRRTLGGAYDKVGKKDARWDAPAREALDLAARMFSQQVDPVVSLPDIHVAAKKAVDAGCDDPMVLYLYARSSVGKFYPKQEEYARRLRAGADAMAAGAYPPIRKAVALLAGTETRMWKEGLTPDERRDVERSLDADIDLLPGSVAEDPRNADWEERWYANINSVIAAHRKLGGDYKAAFDRVDAKLAKVAGIEALRLTVRGNFFMHWGWEARTTRFAAAVGQEQFRTFEERQREARDALEAAYKLKPDQPQVADLMLAVEKGIGGGDRAAMEAWFERAMKADGNDREACWSKLDWLDPKWYGDEKGEELLAFGEACRATKNWRTGITLLAADAHHRYASKLAPADQRKYMWSAPVWAEVREVYEEYLGHFPDDDVERSKYAALCYIGGHFRESHAQFQTLGDRLTTWPAFPNYTLPMLQKIRDDVAQAVAGKPNP